MLPKNLFPSPSPLFAPLTSPAMSTISIEVGVTFFGPISFSKKAKEKIQNRTTKVRSWFHDLNLIMSYWEGEGARSYHHTAPINALYGLHEALLILSEEGIENSWKRHLENHILLRDGLEQIGINFLVNKDDRLPQLNTIFIPEGIDDPKTRSKLLNEYNLGSSSVRL